jgi:hypothetical protein
MSQENPQPWNPSTEPARSVKRVLVRISGTDEVFLNSTMGDLGLGPAKVQTEMNTEFWPEGDKSLSEEQCATDVTAGALTLSVRRLRES